MTPDFCIAYANDTAHLHIIHPAPKARQVRLPDGQECRLDQVSITFVNDQAQLPDGRVVEVETDQAFIQRLVAHSVPSSATWRVIPRQALPPDRRFRDAWRLHGSSVAVDLELAKALFIEEVRQERNRRLADSDAMKARADDIGTPEERQSLATYRQHLRDLPRRVQAQLAALQAPDQLAGHAIDWPTC